jgi:hypothetical protein
MTVHLVKMCVGVDEIDELRRWQAKRLKTMADKQLRHVTRNRPKREAELLDGGSLYWVIKGQIRVRQRVIGLEDGVKEDGKPACGLILDPELVMTELRGMRPMQGWRYLEPKDAPRDLRKGDQLGDMPPQLIAELRALGIL